LRDHARDFFNRKNFSRLPDEFGRAHRLTSTIEGVAVLRIKETDDVD
jgi:hypothetical protein